MKDDITLPKTIKDIEVMGRYCGRAIIYMIECIIKRRGSLCQKKRCTHVWQKKKCILYNIWVQKEKTLYYLAYEKKTKKKKKKRWCFYERKCLQYGGMIFPDFQQR